MLNREFYERDTVLVAQELLGQEFIFTAGGQKLSMIITETEAYVGAIDKASHAYPNKITPRTRIMFQQGGHLYIYLIYGMYYCLNIVTEKEGTAGAVLIRGMEMAADAPEDMKDAFSMNRYQKPYHQLTAAQKRNFSNGPGKICKAFGITKDHNGIDLLSNAAYILPKKRTFSYESGKRINIDYAEEAADFLWRFYKVN